MATMPPDAMTTATLETTPRRGSRLLYPARVSHDATGETAKVTIDDLSLPPDWYRLKVCTSIENAVLSARVHFLEDRRAEFRIQMEPTGKKRFQITFKTAEPIVSLQIAPEGEHAGNLISKVNIYPLGRISIAWFLCMKAVRYARSTRGRISWKVGLMHLRAALNPRGNFVFRSLYERAGQGSYDKWQALYEHPGSGAYAAKALTRRVGPVKSRVGLLVADHLKADAIRKAVETSLIGSAVELSVLGQDALKEPCSGAVDFVLPVDHEGVFPPGAVERLVLELSAAPALAAVFADSDVLAPDGTRQSPRLKPLWDRELLWCTDYIRAPLMVRWANDLHPALDLPGAGRKPAYALALTLVAKRPREALSRLPAILFHQTGPDACDVATDCRILGGHLSALGNDTALTQLDDGMLKVGWRLPATPVRVSIIIPSKDNAVTLKTCIDSIIVHTSGIDYEIVISDNGSTQDRTVRYLSNLSGNPRVKVTSSPGRFNFSKINNDARRHASGDVLVFLNDDTKIISGGWLVELASLARREDAGAVGALLLYPNGSVQHAGVLIGVGGSTDHAFRYLAGEDRGYLDLLRCRREVTAVTGACLAVSAKHFDAVGGFDERLMVTCNDLDLCLRLRAAGLTNIWTPWARLEHWESMTRGVDFTAEALERQADEQRIMSDRWGDLLDRDPTYHPGLSIRAPDYRLST
jgi:GT2 family glycosyltransferase